MTNPEDVGLPKTMYRAIAEDCAAHGETDYEVAYARMKQETIDYSHPHVLLTEIDVMSMLGMDDAEDLLDRLQAVLSERVNRLFVTRGIDIAHPQTVTQLDALEQIGVLSSAERQWLRDMVEVTAPKWPNLEPGHVQNALEWYGVGG